MPATAMVLALSVMAVATLVLQAGADQWTGRAVLPQTLGLRGVRIAWHDPTVLAGVRGSLTVGIAVAAVATLVAWPAARHLAGGRSWAAWAVLGAPVLLPPLVLGDGLATWMIQLGLKPGLFGIGLAHLAVAVPYATLALVPAFRPELDQIDHTAALLGAPPLRRLVEVVLPAAGRHVALALALAFTVSWSQYGTSLAVGGGTPMLPLVLVPYIRADPQAAAVLTLAFLVPPGLALGAAAQLGRAGRRST